MFYTIIITLIGCLLILLLVWSCLFLGKLSDEQVEKEFNKYKQKNDNKRF